VLAARTEPDWVIACIGVECLSMVFFALLQQRLLTAGGARLTAPWLLSIAYLANAVAVAIPVIGSERRVDPLIAKAALALAGVVSTVAFAAVPAGRSHLQCVASRLLPTVQRVLHRPRGDPAQLTKAAMDRLSLFRLGPATLAPAFTWGMLNEAADACCLVLAIKAIGVPVPFGGVLLAWSAGQGAGSFSPTPGGIGVVEVTMTAALVRSSPQ
jgi:putative heme transporter